MILPIVQFGDPVLHQKGSSVKQITSEIRELARDMIETMHAANGVGLAAQQIGKAIQLAVLDVRGSERPSQLLIGGRDMKIDSAMPLVLINPTITQSEGSETDVEGCLSFPGITGQIPRFACVQVAATALEGTPIHFVATGLLGRAVQHELDHLNGILFIDRMAPPVRESVESEIRKIEKTTKNLLKKKR
jgi:peptide deformylase